MFRKNTNNNGSQRLSDLQVRKVYKTMQLLAGKSNNAQVITFHQNLKDSKDLDEMRKWIALFYKDCFQLLSLVNMSINDKREMKDFEVELDKLIKVK